MNSRKIQKAFSLVELMVTLIVISVIVSVCAPIITKKLSSKAITVSEKGGDLSVIRSDCEAFENFGGKCSACLDNVCLLCEITCTEAQYKNIGKCQCENCSDRSTGCLKCSSTGCDLCQSGYYLNEQKDCIICEAGHKCSDGINKEICSAGYYQNLTGQTSCKACLTSNGNYSAQGATSCLSCTQGQYAIDKNNDWDTDGTGRYGTGCATCPKGWYCPDGKIPKPCNTSSNQYSQEGATACSNCSIGYYATNDSSAQGANILGTKCTGCPKGYACPGASQTLKGCGAGYYQDTTIQSTCKTCSGGYYSTGSANTSCSACNSACAICAGSSTTCSSCKSGYYLSSSSCIACPANATCSGGTSTFSCDTYFSKQDSACVRTSCPSGQYLSSSTCKSCPSNATCNGVTFSCNSGYTSNGSGCDKNCYYQNIKCSSATGCTCGWYTSSGWNGAGCYNSVLVCD